MEIQDEITRAKQALIQGKTVNDTLADSSRLYLKVLYFNTSGKAQKYIEISYRPVGQTKDVLVYPFSWASELESEPDSDIPFYFEYKGHLSHPFKENTIGQKVSGHIGSYRIGVGIYSNVEIEIISSSIT